jgi:peptide/nickel transport system substrate-binding protein
VAALAAGLVWGLTAAVATSTNPSPAQGKVILKVGWLADPDNLNPFIGTLSAAFTVWYMNYDPLVGFTYEDLTPSKTLGLATDWSSSGGGKTWTFTLRKNASWQDGQPVTAHDVAFTYNYIIDNEMGNFTSYTEGIKHVTAVDDYTVRFDCLQPKATVVTGYIPILPEHLWSKVTPKAAGATFPNKPPIIGSGPFQCVEFKQDAIVRMIANKSYWGGAPKIDEVDFLSYTNGDTMAQELKSGAIDACGGLLPAQVKSMQSAPGITVKPIVVNGFDELGFNCYTGASLGNPVLKDWRFRQALNYAVDRAKICQIVYGGYGTPGVTPITTDYYKNPDWAWTPPQPYTFDMTKAGQLLDAAGYRDANGDGVRDYKGKPIALRLWARSESPTSQSSGKLLAGWFRQLGLKITLSTVDNGTLLDKQYNTVKGVFTPDYDMFLWGWYSDIDPGIIMSYFTTGQINSWSDCAWSNAEYDSLYKQQAATVDVTQRKELLDRMQEIWYRESPYVILAYSNDIEGWNTAKWGGWITSPAKVGNVVYSPYGPGSFFYVGSKGTATATSSSSATPLIAAVVLVVVVLVGVIVALVLRRRKPRATEETT